MVSRKRKHRQPFNAYPFPCFATETQSQSQDSCFRADSGQFREGTEGGQWNLLQLHPLYLHLQRNSELSRDQVMSSVRCEREENKVPYADGGRSASPR